MVVENVGSYTSANAKLWLEIRFEKDCEQVLSEKIEQFWQTNKYSQKWAKRHFTD